MAGFIPDSLPPVSILTTPLRTPYRDRSHRSATSRISPASISSPATILARPHTRASGAYSSRSRRPDVQIVPDDARPSAIRPESVSPTVQIESPLPHTDNKKSSPSPPTTMALSPAPRRAPSSRQKGNFRLFSRSKSVHIAASKPKRKKLVKKSLSQPTFEIVNPSGPRTNGATEVEAKQLGLQLAEAVAAIQQDSTNVKLARASNDNVTPALDSPVGKRKETIEASTGDDQSTPSDAEQPLTKRWSHAPLLPELDFGSSSSTSRQLFDPKTHEPPPKATIYISALSDTRSGSVDANHSSKNPSKLTYRCDIHAQDGASHRSVEHTCQKVVTKAGGRILNSYFYPGGFLYSLPTEIPEPITSCELPTLEAKIGVEGWTAFSEPRFDGLKLHPPEGRLGGDRPPSTNKMAEGLKSRQNNDLRRVDAWVQSEGVAVMLEPSDENGGKETEKSYGEGGKSHKEAVGIDNAYFPPSRKMTLARSLETIRRRTSGATHTVENNSPSSNHARSPGNSSENRYTVILDASDSDSGSGAEEWESVRSELDS